MQVFPADFVFVGPAGIAHGWLFYPNEHEQGEQVLIAFEFTTVCLGVIA